MALVDVASVEDLEEGKPKVVSVGRREVVLVQWRGRVFALRNVCPHQTQSFAGGLVAGRIDHGDAPGRIVIRDDKPVLCCPWHHWEYELESGRCPIDERVRVRAYDTVVEADRVLIEIGGSAGQARRAAEHGSAPAAAG
jgi:nitrite reductase/ring-hydroxylating ferredoxin subunit